jgi:hypothetical protein
MTTSGTYTLSKTANQLVTAILRWLGYLAAGNSPTPQEKADVIDHINYWLLQQKGPEHVGKPGQMIWLRETASLTLVQSQYLYELKPSGGDLDIQIPVDLLSVVLRDTDNVDTSLSRKTFGEYQLIADKTATGTPIYYAYEKKLAVGNLHIYEAPDATAANYTLELVYRQPIEVITAGTETLDIEDFWYRALIFNVALDVAPLFEVEVSQLHINQAKEATAAMNTFYPENAGNLFFEPERDMDSNYYKNL